MNKTEYKLHYDGFENLEIKGVYLIRNEDNNKLKIGITNNLPRRLKEIRKSFQFCGTIPKLKIECYIEYKHNLELEQFLHKEFKEINYQNEWFVIDDIDIILEKLNDFEYIEPKKEIKLDIKEKNIDIEESNTDDFIEKPIYYYLHNYYEWYDKDNYKIHKIYIKCDGDEESACYMLDNLHGDIFHDWNSFMYCYMKESYKKIDASNVLITKFKELNTNSIIKTQNGDISSLEEYFIIKHNNYLSNTLNDIKEYIDNINIEINNISNVSKVRTIMEEKIKYLINSMENIKENLNI